MILKMAQEKNPTAANVLGNQGADPTSIARALSAAQTLSFSVRGSLLVWRSNPLGRATGHGKPLQQTRGRYASSETPC